MPNRIQVSIKRILAPAAVCVWTCFIAVAAARAQGNLLTNGSFELPTSNGNNEIISGGDSTSLTGWTTVLSGVERFSPTIYGVGSAPDGQLVVDICPFTFTGGGIQQTFSTVVGQQYTLSFLAGTSNAFGRTGDAIVDVFVGNVSQSFTLQNFQATTVYNTYTVPFTATTALTTLTFQNTQDANTHFAFIDRVVIPTAAPEPSPLGLLLVSVLGASLVVTARRRTSR